MSKLFAATIQVLLEAEDQAQACDQVSALLGGSYVVQDVVLDWQYLAPAFHPPVEITEADAKQHFQQYGELTAPDEEEDDAPDLPRDPDFLYLDQKNGLVDLYPATPAALEHCRKYAHVFPRDNQGWVRSMNPLDTPGSITGQYLEGMTYKDITGIDFLYAEDDKGGGYFYPLSDWMRRQSAFGEYGQAKWHGPLYTIHEEGELFKRITQQGLTYHQVEMPK